MKKLIILFTLFITVINFGQMTDELEKKRIQIACNTCHVCETPTKTDPCLGDCPRVHMITVHHTPKEGPENIFMDTIAEEGDKFGPVNFSHRLHAEMSAMSGNCEICHHYNPPGNIIPCADCHEVERKRTDISKPDLKGAYHRQCMECHNEWGPRNDCSQCHDQKEEKKAASIESHPEIETPEKIVYETDFDDGKLVTFFHTDHNKLFNLECADCHQNESCVKCHNPEYEKTQEDLSMEEKHEKCSTCHEVEDDCASCHQSKERKAFNHAQTGFALTGNHAGLECVQCHKTEKSFAGLSQNCNNCHSNWNVDNFEHSITGFELSETHAEFDCESCHEERAFSKKPSCEMCHDEDISYPDFEPGERISG